jgi:hypothetical protein
MKSSINKILETQLKASTVDWINLKTDYQDLKRKTSYEGKGKK